MLLRQNCVSARGENPKMPHTLAELEANFRHFADCGVVNFELRQPSSVLQGVCTNGLKKCTNLHPGQQQAMETSALREQKHSLLMDVYMFEK